LAALSVDQQSGGREHVPAVVGIKIPLLSCGHRCRMGSQDLGPTGMIGCQSVVGGLGEGPWGQTGID
jgi:hypothetical protein